MTEVLFQSRIISADACVTTGIWRRRVNPKVLRVSLSHGWTALLHSCCGAVKPMLLKIDYRLFNLSGAATNATLQRDVAFELLHTCGDLFIFGWAWPPSPGRFRSEIWLDWLKCAVGSEVRGAVGINRMPEGCKCFYNVVSNTMAWPHCVRAWLNTVRWCKGSREGLTVME